MLAGKVALVTGASQGIGRGIALQLGTAGVVVYITGRTLESKGSASLGSLKATAAEVEARGGTCIPVQCDHSNDADVVKVFDKIRAEQGRLDILVNNAYSGGNAGVDNSEKKFWEQDVGVWDAINNVGLRGHYICAVLASRMMVAQGNGLIINISSLGGKRFMFLPAYGIGKCAVDRMAADCAKELRPRGVAFVSLWPGAVRTERMLATLKAHPDNKSLHNLFEHAESTEFVGMCVTNLALDRKIMDKSGQVVFTAELASEYGFKDIDGREILSIMSLQIVLSHVGWKRTATMFPGWCKLPQWLFWWLASRVED